MSLTLTRYCSLFFGSKIETDVYGDSELLLQYKQEVQLLWTPNL